MSKGSMLKLAERNGRGQSGLAAALPVQLHSQLVMSSSLVDPATAQRENWSEGLVNPIGGPPTRSVRPSSRATELRDAQKHC
jgi:hypothetical protein